MGDDEIIDYGSEADDYSDEDLEVKEELDTKDYINGWYNRTR